MTALLVAVCAATFGLVGGVPFAMISNPVQAAIVAGILSFVNTILNVRLLRVVTQNREKTEEAKRLVEETHGAVDRRKRKAPPPDRKHKRKGDK
jgi:hypothetical protein